MIGLGSNRLSVCRRGGMSVTQAGRGGMELLAVGRMPSWASPYSAQATAALKAQFPTQWQTIRDYGFAHPALVPFINEDPMLVMSLIEGLGTRTITPGKTRAYIDTHISRTEGTYVKTRACITEWVSENFLFGAMLASSPYNRNYIKAESNGSIQLGFGASCPNSGWRAVLNTVYDIDCFVSKTSAYLHFDNNTVSASGNQTISSNTLKIFSNDYAKNTYPSTFKVYDHFEIYEIDKVTLIADYVPCKHIVNGLLQNGMLDIKSATWEPNANNVGSFTISETPAS